jgi:hypothetical protein
VVFIPQAVSAPLPFATALRNVTCSLAARDLFFDMKKITLLGAFIVLAASLAAQSPVADDQKQLEAMLEDVQAQQLEIADNQIKIDGKLAQVAEAIRVARIYASRGGR